VRWPAAGSDAVCRDSAPGSGRHPTGVAMLCQVVDARIKPPEKGWKDGQQAAYA